jgi:hypothetical protein
MIVIVLWVAQATHFLIFFNKIGKNVKIFVEVEIYLPISWGVLHQL